MIDCRVICLRHIRYGVKRPWEHRHDFFQLCYVLSGAGYVTFDGVRYRIGAGEVHIYHPFHTHDIWTAGVGPLDTLDLRFSVCDKDVVREIRDVAPFLRSDTEEVLHLIRHIEQEGIDRKAYWLDRADALLAQMLIEIVRHKREAPAKQHEMKEASRIMHDSLPAGLKISELAHRLHMNPKYFSILFRAYYGQSPQDYMVDLKLERIKHLLLVDPGLQVGAIAARFGWHDTRHFRRVFMKKVGESPSDFRRRHVNEATDSTVESVVFFHDALPMEWHAKPT